MTSRTQLISGICPVVWHLGAGAKHGKNADSTIGKAVEKSSGKIGHETIKYSDVIQVSCKWNDNHLTLGDISSGIWIFESSLSLKHQLHWLAAFNQFKILYDKFLKSSLKTKPR